MSVEAVTWALSVPIGGNAKVVLIGLANHAWPDGTESYPALDRLATYAHCDRSTARRNVRKLVAAGWIDEDGKGPKGTMKYRLRVDRVGGSQNATPETGDGGVALATRGGGTGDAGGVAFTASGGGIAMPPEPSLEPSLEPSMNRPARAHTREAGDDPRQDPRVPRSVNRKPVTRAEADLTARILSYWTARTETRPITGTDVGRAVVGRLRDDPDLSAEEHRRIIDANLAAPFWSGKAPPTVLYGNGRAWASAKLKADSDPAELTRPLRGRRSRWTAAEMLELGRQDP